MRTCLLVIDHYFTYTLHRLFIYCALWASISSLYGQAIYVDHWETIIHAQEEWHYATAIAAESAPADNWYLQDFTLDSSWSLAPGGIGFGDGDDGTTIDPCYSLYIRKEFQIQQIENIAALVLWADYDDAFIAYLNGVEIARSNIGEVGFLADFDASIDYRREAHLFRGALPEQYLIPSSRLASLLQEGENTLAVQVLNDGISSSDLSANFWLCAGLNTPIDSSLSYQANPDWFVEPVLLQQSHLPIVEISTNDHEPIPDDPRVIAQMRIIHAGSNAETHISDPANVYNGRISIEMRGSSSQTRFPKKSFSLETQTNTGENNNVSLLGLPEENDWILYGPYSDKSLQRNALLYHIARKMGNYAPRSVYVELIINDTYQGLYLLMERIKWDKNRLDIKKTDPEDISGDNLTGGYILKIDKLTGETGSTWVSEYPAPHNPEKSIRFECAYPKPDDLQPEQLAYLQEYLAQFENVLNSPNYTDSLSGYRRWIDTDSFIDYLLCNELSYNVDGLRMSTFLHKNRNSIDGRLKMGPVWDFNLAFGNGWDCDVQNSIGYLKDYNIVCPNNNYHIPFWWDRLLSDPYFSDQLQCQWQDYRHRFLHTDSVFQYLDQQAASLGAAIDRNFNKWPILPIKVWPNFFQADDYTGELELTKQWIQNRLEWLDENLWGNCSYYANYTGDQLRARVYPNPVSQNSALHFSYHIPLDSYASAEVFNAQGQLVLIPLQRQVHLAGSYELQIDTERLSSGIYFIRFRAINEYINIPFVLTD